MKPDIRSKWFTAACFCLLLASIVAFVYIAHHNNTNNGATSNSGPSQSQGNSTATGSSQTATTTNPDEDQNGCYTPSSVRNHYDETHCVDYTVAYTHETSAGTKFLDEKTDYYDGFVGYIPYNSAAETMDINSLQGKNIVVTGQIQEYSGYPEIVINDYSQVKVYN